VPVNDRRGSNPNEVGGSGLLLYTQWPNEVSIIFNFNLLIL